jgi:hypothetical protein
MTVLASYTDLTTELASWLNRADLTDKIPTFVRLFEARMNRRLRSPDMEVVATQDTVAGTETYALPADARQITEIHLASDPKVVLEGLTLAVLRDTYDDNTQSQPQAYAISGESLVLAPVPDGAYTMTLTYHQTLTGLDSGNATNWLLDDHPDVYLFGSLCMAEAYLKDDDRLAVWKAAWDEALAEIIREANDKRLASQPIRARPSVIE